MEKEDKKYNTLLNILDKLRKNAPLDYISYHPNKEDLNELNKARSKAFIHLFLKTKCGLISFNEQFDHILEGGQDGGIDAFYFNHEKKELLLIQSKFRTSSENFKHISLSADDLVKMEITRILKGEKEDSRGKEFNYKVQLFQKKWFKISDHARWDTKVIFLGNLKHSDEQIRRLIDGNKYEIFDFERAYEDLVFPFCCGTYYDPEEIKITINLEEDCTKCLKQKVSTSFGEYDVRVLFVPTKEIGRVLNKYKNSILKYNPRNYLSLSKNKVNQKIKQSITHKDSNDFAVFNNGITILAKKFDISESTGIVDKGQIILESPQIINGGQTAHTLSKIYDECSDPEGTFKNKEVMLKVIVLRSSEPNLDFIEEISNATNNQTRVEEGDRRSNEKVQIDLQREIYSSLGYFYERKKGEFYYAMEQGILNKDSFLDRYDFLRSYLAFKGDPASARRSGGETLFKYNKFKEIMEDGENFKKKLLPYMIFRKISEIKSKEEKDVWGAGLRYGKMAIIAASRYLLDLEDLSLDNIYEFVDDVVKNLSAEWSKFELQLRNLPSNADYVLLDGGFDFDNYYKGKTINSDIKVYFDNLAETDKVNENTGEGVESFNNEVE